MSPRERRGMTTDAAPPSLVAAPLAPGVVIADRYRLEARLGAGGGGTVWRCHDDKLAATVALKIVAAGGDLERWRREVAMARRIADRNVCRVHDLGETGELRFVTMELIEGTSLRHRVRPDLPAAEARALFAQIVAGAAAIHAAGVVHRDLKPENIVVASDGRVVIVDFGLAREPRLPGGISPGDTAELPDAAATLNLRIGDADHGDTQVGSPGATVTDAGVAVGTPRYMSPEQAAGDAVDARTDVWALGLIGHELLTGALPRPDPDAPSGRRIDPVVDARLPGAAAVLRRCLALDPGDRYADASQLHAAIAALVDPGTRGSLARRRRARLALAATAIAGAATAAVLIVRSGALRSGASSGSGAASAVRPVTPHRTGDVELFPIVTEPRYWPSESPMSVAVARDGKRFAYTTAGGELLVQELAPGARPEKWTPPRFQRTPGGHAESLITMWCAGWFSDDSIALIGTTYRDGYHLFRVYRDGRSTLLHSQAPRFTAAVTRDDRVVIGIDGDAVFMLAAGHDPDQILPLEPGELAMAIAASPDGRRVAVARLPAAPAERARIQVVTPGDRTMREVWSGETSARYDTLLVWLDDGRLAFTRRDPVSDATTIYTVDAVDPAELRARGTGESYGIGSAAAGTVLMMRGRDQVSVQIGNAKAEQLAPVEANVPASRIAGWTDDGRLVFAMGTPGRVVRAIPGRGAEPWPGTSDGVEIPDTVVGDSVITHRLDPTAPRPQQVVVERIDPTGHRTELARAPADRAADTLVRCAGDHAPPCMLQEITGKDVSWIEIDPATGERKRVLHTRGVGGRAHRDAALSPDGKTLAIVEGTPEVIVVMDPGGNVTRSYSAGGDAALQSVAFAPGGDIWATSIGFHGRLFGLMTFEYRARWNEYTTAWSRGSAGRDALRWFWRPTVSPDGTRVAAVVREFHTEIMRVQGL